MGIQIWIQVQVYHQNWDHLWVWSQIHLLYLRSAVLIILGIQDLSQTDAGPLSDAKRIDSKMLARAKLIEKLNHSRLFAI